MFARMGRCMRCFWGSSCDEITQLTKKVINALISTFSEHLWEIVNLKVGLAKKLYS